MPLFLSLLRSETAADPAAASAALAGLRAYQDAPRVPRPPAMPVVATAGRAVLRDFGGEGRPVIFVPSLINAADVLDLAEDNSMLRWLSRSGVRPLLLDWGAPARDESALSIAGHVETMLLPLLDAIGPDAALAGYCLGGTMAVAAAALRPVAGLALIVAPWRFAGYPQEARLGLGDLWAMARPAAGRLGYFPLEVLQAGFWRIDPARVVAKYAAFGRMDPASAAARAFVALEDWSNGGAPLTRAAGTELAEAMMRDDLPGRGAWHVGGAPVVPAKIACPIVEVVSTSDRIVPAASAAGVGERLTIGQGHVGMIVGGRAEQLLWRPLAGWLSQLRNHC